MSWAKFDDLYDDGKKIKRAWRANRATIGLHAMAVTYSSRHETDGLLDIEWITDKLPAKGEREKVLAVLVDCGLFEVVDDAHYRVHDFLDYNPSRAQQDEKRRREAERKARGRAAQAARHDGDVRADTSRTPTGRDAESGGPDPTRPEPTTPLAPRSGGDGHRLALVGDDAPMKPAGNRRTDQAKYRAAMSAWATTHFPDVHPDGVASVITEIRSYRTNKSLPLTVTATDAVDYVQARGGVWPSLLGITNTTGEAA